MHSRFARLTLLLSLVVVPLFSINAGSAAPAATSTFQRTWDRTDKPVADLAVNRTWMWGPAVSSEAVQEPYAEAPGGTRTVQYFDKSRMEDNSYRASDPWDVTNGLLVVELMTGNMQVGDDAYVQESPAQVNVGGDADDPSGPTYATMGLVSHLPPLPDGAIINLRLARDGSVTTDPSLTGYMVTAAHHVSVPNLNHQVASVFWDFMNSSGTVWDDGQLQQDKLFLNPFYATGYPVTEAYWANIKVGGVYKDVLLQCFERRCLTYTPDNPTGWKVEAGNVGQHYFYWRYIEPGSKTVWTKAADDVVNSSTANYHVVPSMELNVTAPESGDMAITFSANTSGDGGQIFVRAVVDGQVASPSDVYFALGGEARGVRSFTFSMNNVSKGSHAVRIDWQVGTGHTGTMAFRTLTVMLEPPGLDRGLLKVTTPSIGPADSTTSAYPSWTNVPGLATSVFTGDNAQLSISVSAEAWTDSASLYLRVLIDGQPASPWTRSTVFAYGPMVGTTAFTWNMQHVAEGTHQVQVQWTVDGGATGYMRYRTLTVSGSPIVFKGGLSTASTAADLLTLSAPNWTIIPDLTSTIVTPPDGVIAITFSAEGWVTTGGVLLLAMVIDGHELAAPESVYFATAHHLESRSFTFVATDLTPGTHTIQVAWAPAGPGQTAYLWNRSLSIVGRPAR